MTDTLVATLLVLWLLGLTLWTIARHRHEGLWGVDHEEDQ